MFPELEELIGEWDSVAVPGKVEPRAQRGGWRFRHDLDGKVIVRENWSEGTRPDGSGTYRHTDLMVISDSPLGGVEAHYWDSEGHHIQYHVRALSEPDGVEFLSEAPVHGSAYRLTYTMKESGKIVGTFEIRQPTSNRFQPFLEWAGVRKGPRTAGH